MPNWKAPGARLLLLVALALALAAWAAMPQAPAADPHRAEAVLSLGEAPRWAIAIHGGAGVMSRAKMADGGTRHTSPRCAPPWKWGEARSRRGEAASIRSRKWCATWQTTRCSMPARERCTTTRASTSSTPLSWTGAAWACGAVAAVKTVKNPISLARLVMQRSPHVLLVGEGADRFAAAMGVERVSQDYFHTAHCFEEWQRELRRRQGAPERDHGTVGAVALDRQGNLAAATSTGGTTDKLPGRVGDSPILGAGTYANNRTCAVSGTGAGEEFIRHTVAYDISALVEYRGATLQQAARQAEAG
jgi:beta-aspartyl-peptidase (threonine type)